jgi:cysteine sulfinate desulfinase/cysteine desulfurase-like protein
VLMSIGFEHLWGLGSLRVTLGAHSSPEHVDAFLSILPDLVEKARKLR